MCQNAKVGDKINFTVSLFGDGAALKPKPIDAMLVMDKSQSMTTTMDGGKSRLDWAKIAGSTFVGKMDQSRDLVGLTTFGTDATVDYTLSNNFVAVNNSIKNMNYVMYTATRKGLKLAIDNFPAYITGDKTVRAIVLMTDGEYNYYGDPLARGTGIHSYAWTTTYSDRHYYFSGLGGTSGVSGADQFTNQNMSIYAKSKNIRIYTVSFGDGINSGLDTWKVLDNLANSTGGQHYHANTGAQLQDIYTLIAGQLQETAGANTVVSLDFGTVKINDVIDTGDNLTKYMDYIPDLHSPVLPTDSTYLNKTNLTPSGTMYFLEDYPKNENDQAAWAAHAMTFNVGTIKLNNTWSVAFRLNLTQAGKIDLFGPDNPSRIAFTDASTGKTTYQNLSPCSCTIAQSITNVPFGDKNLFVDNLSATNNGPNPDILTLKWNTTYDGQKTAQETVSFRNLDTPNSHYVPVPNGILFEGPCSEKTDHLTVDTTSWTPGLYSIEVVAVAMDAGNSGVDTITWNKEGPNTPKYIKLE